MKLRKLYKDDSWNRENYYFRSGKLKGKKVLTEETDPDKDVLVKWPNESTSEVRLRKRVMVREVYNNGHYEQEKRWIYDAVANFNGIEVVVSLDKFKQVDIEDLRIG